MTLGGSVRAAALATARAGTPAPRRAAAAAGALPLPGFGPGVAAALRSGAAPAGIPGGSCPGPASRHLPGTPGCGPWGVPGPFYAGPGEWVRMQSGGLSHTC